MLQQYKNSFIVLCKAQFEFDSEKLEL